MLLLKNKRFWSWIFIFWLVCLVVLSIIPNLTPESLQMKDESLLRTDYIQHLLVFLILPVLYYLSDGQTFIDRFISSPRVILFAGILFACFTEALQLAVPGRTFNPVDMLLNAMGVLAGAGLVWLWRRKMKTKLIFGIKIN